MSEKCDRKCVACRQTKKQYDMLRFTKINGEILFDAKHNLGGRGAYVCKNNECIALTIKKHLLNRAFKMNVNEEVYLKLKEYEKDN